MEENLLGMPLIKRRDYILKLKEGKPINQIYIFSGEGTPKEQKVDVYMVNIEVPIYRLKNIRTKSPQLTYIAKKGLNQDFFSKDPEDREALSAQHELLLSIADSKDEKSHLKTFQERDYDKQHPMMMSSEGVLVNGNTRMSALRHLYNQNKVEYRRYESVPVAILPPEFSERDFRALELHLQINPDIKKDYSWVSEALDCRERIAEGYSLEELIEAYGREKKDIGNPKNLLDQITIADYFLEKSGNVNDYDSLEKDQYSLWAWADWRNNYQNDEIKKKLIDIECFQIIKNKSQLSEMGIKGDLYKNIKKKMADFKNDPLLWEGIKKQFVKDVLGEKAQENKSIAEVNSLLDDQEPSNNNKNLDNTLTLETKNIEEVQTEDQGTNESVTAISELNRDIEQIENNSNAVYSWMMDFEKDDLNESHKGEVGDDDILMALKKVEEEDIEIISTFENVLSTRKEEFKRSADKNLIFNDSIEIKSNVSDCISRLKNSDNDFEKLPEALNELMEAKQQIEELIILIQNKL